MEKAFSVATKVARFAEWIIVVGIGALWLFVLGYARFILQTGAIVGALITNLVTGLLLGTMQQLGAPSWSLGVALVAVLAICSLSGHAMWEADKLENKSPQTTK